MGENSAVGGEWGPYLGEGIYGELRDRHEFVSGDEATSVAVELAEAVVQRNYLLLRD